MRETKTKIKCDVCEKEIRDTLASGNELCNDCFTKIKGLEDYIFKLKFENWFDYFLMFLCGMFFGFILMRGFS